MKNLAKNWKCSSFKHLQNKVKITKNLCTYDAISWKILLPMTLKCILDPGKMYCIDILLISDFEFQVKWVKVGMLLLVTLLFRFFYCLLWVDRFTANFF